MSRSVISKIVVFLIPVLILLFIGMFVVASKIMSQNAGPAERAPTAEEREDLDYYVANFVERVSNEDLGGLAVDHSALLTKFNKSTEFFTMQFQNSGSIDQLLRDQISTLGDDYEISPETVSIHKVTALRKGRIHVVLKITETDGWEEIVDYYKLELVKRGSNYKLYDAGYWLYSMSFCEGLYVEEDSARSRALARYGLILPDGDTQKFYDELDAFDVSELPAVYQIDYKMAKANCLKELGRLDDAAEVYKSFATRPDQAAAAYGYARCLFEAERYDEVEAALLPYLSEIGRDSSSLRLLAETSIAMEDLEAAGALYSELLSVSSAREYDAIEQYVNCLNAGDKPADGEDQTETLREFVYTLAESNPERVETLSMVAYEQENSRLLQVIHDMVADTDPDAAQLDELKGLQAEMSSNNVAAAAHYLAAYHKAADKSEDAEAESEDAVQYFYQWLYTVADDVGPLAALKNAPLQEEAYTTLVEDYVWNEGLSDEWKPMLDHVVAESPQASWVLYAQGEYAEEQEEWNQALSFFERAHTTARENNEGPVELSYMEMSVARTKARLGRALEVFQESEDKANTVRMLSRVMTYGEQTEDLDDFLQKTVGEQGVDEGKPFTGNRELLDGEDGLEPNELLRMWSDLRFLQKRYKESRQLAMNAQTETDHWELNWNIGRTLDCLIGEKKYPQALAWIDQHEMSAFRKSEVFVAKKDVPALVELVKSLRETDEGEYSDRRIHYLNGDVMDAPPFVKPLKAIDFDFLVLDNE